MGVSTVTVFESQIPGVKITELKQLLSHEANEGKTIILVEGIDDRTFYVRYVSEPNVVFSVLNSCHFMPDILSRAKSDKVLAERVIGIKDADFDRILGKDYHLDNLFITDTHDWETMAQTNESERNVTIEALGRTETGIFTKVMNDLKNYSYLKLYNIAEICDKGKEGINFRDFSISNIYNGEDECEVDKCLEKVKDHNNNARLPHFPGEEEIAEVKTAYPNPDPLQFTCGHDVIQGVVQRIIHLKGTSTEVGVKETARIFRTTFTADLFKTTQLYRDIANWSQVHNAVVWAA